MPALLGDYRQCDLGPRLNYGLLDIAIENPHDVFWSLHGRKAHMAILKATPAMAR